ncbi:hypothetical protein J6V86_03245 [bacterium]|nr:hypothetical protein [bacterium]
MCEHENEQAATPTYECTDDTWTLNGKVCSKTTTTTAGCGEDQRVTIYRNATDGKPGFADFFLVGGTYAKVFKK